MFAVGKPNTVTHKGGLDFIKNSRNSLDKVTLTDGLESSLEKTATDVVAQTITAIKGSPSAKKAKKLKDIQELINLTLEEIKQLETMGPEFETERREAYETYRRLLQQRKQLRGVSKNLEEEMAESDD